MCSYILRENQLVISCCATADQLAALTKSIENYYLDVCNECLPTFKTVDLFAKKDEDPGVQSLIAQKRSSTLKRIECKNIYN